MARLVPRNLPGGDVLALKTHDGRAGLLLRYDVESEPAEVEGFEARKFLSVASAWRIPAGPLVPATRKTALFVHFGANVDLNLVGAVCDEVLALVDSGHCATPSALVDCCASIAEKWAALLAAFGDAAIDQSAVVGLFGELAVLQRFAGQVDGFAIQNWRGPESDRYDFRTATFALEVKATLMTDRWRIVVHGHDQLEPTSVPSWLAVMRMELDPAGKSLEALAGECADLLPPMAVQEFWSKLSSLGFDDAGLKRASGLTFREFDGKVLPLTRSFPRISEASLVSLGLSARVSELSYTLDVADIEGEHILFDWDEVVEVVN